MDLRHTHAQPGLRAVIRREVDRIGASWFPVLSLFVLPAMSALIIVATFGTGVVRDLPVRVVDHDGSLLSARLVRMLDATPGLRVAGVDRSLPAAERAVLRGASYGTIVVPAHFERDGAAGRSARVQVFYNAQYVVPASTVRREALAAITALSASLEREARARAGQHPERAAVLTDPIVVDTQTIGNVALSYVPYLVAGVLPTLLQIFVMVVAVDAFGSELRRGTAQDWFAAAGDRAWVAIAGKLLPYACLASATALAMLALTFGPLGVPLNGSLAVVSGATVLLVLAYLSMGFAATALTGNLRLATSLAAFYSVPAFAFAGITFPTFGMPVAGQAWSSLLPLSHYLRLLFDQALRGAPLATAEPPLLALAAFATVPWVMLGWRMAALARNPRAWGRL